MNCADTIGKDYTRPDSEMICLVTWGPGGSDNIVRILVQNNHSFKLLIHTARARNREQYKELDWHNRKQWVLVPVPVSDQCEHIYKVLYFGPCTGPAPLQCEYTINSSSNYPVAVPPSMNKP